MLFKILNLKKDIKKEQSVQDVVDNCFISRYTSLFTSYLQKLSPESREIIRKNKELDELFDLFLDFIIDSTQHLDYKDAKEKEKNLLNS